VLNVGRAPKDCFDAVEAKYEFFKVFNRKLHGRSLFAGCGNKCGHRVLLVGVPRAGLRRAGRFVGPEQLAL
jgi:hypothetical protein